MDVERTMEFIRRMQAKSEVQGARFDKRLDATRKLVEKSIVKIEKRHLEAKKDRFVSKKDFDHRLNALLDAQKKTDQKLDRLIDFWGKRWSNGLPQ
jgi:hypothetical protein